ncbi:MAG: hypothetical protein H6797_03925 [Candidatus Nomurabacteria bacterium]|nr:MAG: hypothetical protein H6797_03925 [Candidatus Nomurabacteria bacterium]
MGYNHPFGKAVLYAIVLFAVAHLALSLFYGIVHSDPEIANMFHVLGIDLFWPQLGLGRLNAVLGVVMIVAVWLFVGLMLVIANNIKVTKKVVKEEKKKK